MNKFDKGWSIITAPIQAHEVEYKVQTRKGDITHYIKKDSVFERLRASGLGFKIITDMPVELTNEISSKTTIQIYKDGKLHCSVDGIGSSIKDPKMGDGSKNAETDSLKRAYMKLCNSMNYMPFLKKQMLYYEPSNVANMEVMELEFNGKDVVKLVIIDNGNGNMLFKYENIAFYIKQLFNELPKEPNQKNFLNFYKIEYVEQITNSFNGVNDILKALEVAVNRVRADSQTQLINPAEPIEQIEEPKQLEVVSEELP